MAYVSHYLKPYAKAESASELTALLERLQLAEGVNGYHYERDPNTGRVLVLGGPEQKTGSYLLDGPVKVDSGTVATPHPLRLIVHNNGSSARLLQKVFHGISPGSNTVIRDGSVVRASPVTPHGASLSCSPLSKPGSA